MLIKVCLGKVNKRRRWGRLGQGSCTSSLKMEKTKSLYFSGEFKVLPPRTWSSVLAEATLPCRALSSELFMKFQWCIRDKRWRTKPENQLFFFSYSWPQREEYSEPQSSWQICAPSPVLKSFLGHLSQAPAVLRFRSRFTKLKNLPGGSSFVFLSYQSPVMPLWLLSSRPSFQSLPSKHRGTFLSPNCPLVFEKLWREATCGACLVIGCVSAALQSASCKWLCYGI